MAISLTTTSMPLAARRHRSAPYRIGRIALSLVVVGIVFLAVLPRVADYAAAWSNIKEIGWLAFAALLVVTVLHLSMYWPQMVASLPGLTLAQAAVSNQTSTSVANTVPGGGVVAVGVSYSMCRSWGFTDTQIALSTLVTFVWNVFAKLALPVVALVVLVVAGRATGGMLIATLGGVGLLGAAIAVLALMLWREAFARRVSMALGSVHGLWFRLIRRPRASDWGDSGVRFRAHSIELIGARWRSLTVSTLAGNVTLFLILLIALRSVGVAGTELTWTQVLGVFAVVRLLSTFPITPGGIGFVELGYIGGLVLAAGPHPGVSATEFHAQVAAAVLIFRVLTYAVPIPIGAFTYLVWDRKRSWRASPRQEEPVKPNDVLLPA
jgi:putative heme transporter